MNKHLSLCLILAVASQINAMETNGSQQTAAAALNTPASPLLSRPETAEEIGIRYINLERLCTAITNNKVSEVVVALSKIKDVNATLPDTQDTPLHVAYHSPTPNVEIIALLLARGANQTALNKYKVTPMEQMVQLWRNSQLLKVVDCSTPFMSLANEIIHNGANPSTQKSETCSVLSIALSRNAFDVALLLIQKGADVKKTYDNSNTALHILAAQITSGQAKRAIPVAQALLDAGVLIDAKNDFGQTPIEVAQSNYWAKELKKFLKRTQNPVKYTGSAASNNTCNN